LSPRPAEEIVAEKAQLRVDLLMTSKVEESYALTTPGYRATATAQQYQLAWGGAGMWKKVEIQNVSCTGEPADRCRVTLAVTYRMPRMAFENTTLLPETWIFTSGDWYLFQE
jgi:hypothetical protein